MSQQIEVVIECFRENVTRHSAAESAMPVPESLNILHVVDSLERGGLERVVTDLAIAQHAAGHGVHIFCLYRLGAFADDLQSSGIRVSCGDKRDGLDWHTLWRLRSAAVSQRCHIVHAHNLVPNYYSALAILGLFRRPALVNTCHDMGTRLSDAHLLRMYRWSLSRTAKVAMVADQVYQRYVGDGLVAPERARTILNGVPTRRFAPSAQRRQAARQTLNLPMESVVIGCVGRLVALKNHQIIIQSLPLLLRSHPHVRVVLVGGGELENELRSQTAKLGVKDQVTFAGERADVADLLPAFDIFAQPSLTEGLSVALLEAASSGLAIMATNVGGNPKIIRDGITGLLVPPQDQPATEAAMLKLLCNSALRARISSAALAWANENASIDAMQLAYDRLYHEARTGGRLKFPATAGEGAQT